MESLFPQILYLGPMFAPLALRLGAALAVALMAHNFYTRRVEFGATVFPVIGKPGTGLAWFAIVATALLALMLTVGLWTQVAAVLAGAGALKSWYFAKSHPALFPMGRTAYLLLVLICATLVILGAGAFAIDKPY